MALATTRHNPKQRCPRCDELLQAAPAARPPRGGATPVAPAESTVPAKPAKPPVDAPTASPPVAPAGKRKQVEAAARQTDHVPAVAPPIAADAVDEAPATAAPPPVTPAAKRKSVERAGHEADRAKAITAPIAADAIDVVAAAAEVLAEPASAITPTLEDSIAASTGVPAIARTAPPRQRSTSVRGTPSFVRVRQPARPQQRSWRGPVAIVVLSLALLLQLLLAQRAELAAQARWRPVVAAVCGIVRCELPPWREPAAFTMLSRNVQPKPGLPGVLTVSAGFRNDARWPQPWPTLVLSLSDVDGRQVGQRAFAPAEYRDGGAAADLLAPGQSAAVQLDVIEPAPRIVAFTFDFR